MTWALSGVLTCFSRGSCASYVCIPKNRKNARGKPFTVMTLTGTQARLTSCKRQSYNPSSSTRLLRAIALPPFDAFKQHFGVPKQGERHLPPPIPC
jgi:hypothetical protein